MKEFSYTINDPIGLHARPAGLIVRQAAAFASDITIECRGKTADAKKLFALMGMGVKNGDDIIIRIQGDDEAEAASVLLKFMQENI